MDPAAALPVAVVALAHPLPHLDQPFDYLVPARLDADVQPGVRVKVPFAGRDLDGFVLRRVPRSEHPGTLRAIRRTVGTEPVATAQILGLATAVARAHAGTTADVLRLAIPPRHARAETQVPPAGPAPPLPAAVPLGEWANYRGGPAFLDRVRAGEAPRAVLTALPGAAGGGPDDPTGWAALLAAAALTAAAAGRGCIIAVPDGGDIDTVLAALEHERERLDPQPPPEWIVRYSADLGPARRYRAFLAALRGHARIVVGTRAASYAPVRDLGLLICWDDADPSHREPRAPYPSTLRVLRQRADLAGAAALVAGHGRSVDAAHLSGTGWAKSLPARGEVLRARTALVHVTGEDWHLERDPAARVARVPGLALRAARDALAAGRPVLFCVPRAGYRPALSCARCRAPARCRSCSARLASTHADASPACPTCGRTEQRWRCAQCGHHHTRAAAVGVRRTAEEIGAALPGQVVRTSSGAAPVRTVPARAGVALATPGVEPAVAGGYGAVVILDTWVSLNRPGLGVAQDAVHRWMRAMSLAAPDGRVIVVGDPSAAPVQALVRHDPAGFADRELAERATLGLPPAGVLAAVTGRGPAVAGLAEAVRWPDSATVTPIDPSRLIVTGPGEARVDIATRIRQGLGALATAKRPLPRVRMDADVIDEDAVGEVNEQHPPP